MKTPIYDFARSYSESGTVRMHMPGHKGKSLLGFEHLDITEITGADDLYNADGIIAESEREASRLFGANTFYSTEGSSLCIRAMLYLVAKYAATRGEKPSILACRNAHKVFIYATAMLDVEVNWLFFDGGSYLSCTPSAAEIEQYLSNSQTLPTAVYLTSPDYLGNICDVRGISKVCHRFGVLLLVDNAHGAYTKFLNCSAHPIDLGADICCDSAHKTLPALTGCAYLHISHGAPAFFRENAKPSLSLFGSTSPSYLLLASLDKVNEYIENGYRERLDALVKQLDGIKKELTENGYSLIGDEPLKFTVDAKQYGYTGIALARLLREAGIECEFSDNDFVVAMLTPESDVLALKDALLSIPRRSPITESAPLLVSPTAEISIREAIFAPSERIPTRDAVGRILANPCLSCPPAVPIVVSGERITEDAVAAMLYYGIEHCDVVF
ncbi:MAG: amino acid decarboxylase [Ruminococcaceae bacterium]|nr:amino acid decarboxylase [Oscillospiraceae bacterium]